MNCRLFQILLAAILTDFDYSGIYPQVIHTTVVR